MTRASSLRRLLGPARRPLPKTARRARLAVEALEAREVPAVFTVNTPADENDGINTGGVSLREAIDAANATSGDDTIQVNVTGTIQLGGVLPDLKTNIAITGPGAGQLTVRGKDYPDDFRIFNVLDGATVSISGLTVSNGADTYGGGFYNDAGCTLTLTDCTVSDNSAHNGGGIRNDGTLTLTRCTVGGNLAEDGGGIINYGELTLTDSTVGYNSGYIFSGGGIHNKDGATLTMTGCTVNGNTSTAGGGGIANDANGTLTMTNCTVSGNGTGGSGGGISNRGTLTLTNCTLTQNRANGSATQPGGGGLQAGKGTARLVNTIVAGNTQEDDFFSVSDNDISGIKVDTAGSVNNLIGVGGSGGLADGTNGNQVGVADAHLGPLADNGGPTLTHALLAGSPAINAGNNAAAAGLATDQRGAGFARVNGTVDIGAFEVQDGAPTAVALDNASVAENRPAGTVVGTLSTTDPDAGDTFTYSLVGGDVAAFKVVGDQLQTAAAFDFETKDSYTVRVRSADAFGLYTEAEYVIGVTDVNEAPALTGDAVLPAVDEDATDPAGQSIADLFAGATFSDPDAGASLAGVLVLPASLARTTQGRWEFSVNGGAGWTDFAAADVHNAAAGLVLSADTLVRFVPAANFYGDPPALTVRALDNTQTDFTNSSWFVYRDPGKNGGETPVAAGTNTIGTSVTMVPPDTAIDTGPATFSPSANATFTFSGTDGAHPTTLTFEYTLDGGAWTPGRSPLTLTGLPDGLHKFRVRAVDESGNADPTPAGRNWLVDTVKPAVSVGGPSVSVAKNGTSVTYTLTYSDTHFDKSTLAAGDITLNRTGTANGDVSVDAGTGTTRTVTISNVTGDGTLGITVKAGTALDLAGNKAAASAASATFTVDNTGPALTISAAAPATTVRGPVTWKVSASDLHPGTFGLTSGDIILVGSTATLTAKSVSVSGPDRAGAYTVTVDDIRGGAGTLKIKVKAGVAADAVGNPSAEKLSSGVTVSAPRKPSVVQAAPPAYVLPGSTLKYAITYSNPVVGTQTLTGAYLVVQVPAYATFRPDLSTAGWMRIAGTGPVRYRLDLGDLAPGAHGTASFVVTFASGIPTGTSLPLISKLMDVNTPATSYLAAYTTTTKAGVQR